jgi:hypothetical protein
MRYQSKMLELPYKNTMTWTKKSRNGCLEWEKASIEARLWSRGLKIPMKTRFASKFVLFQETTKTFFNNKHLLLTSNLAIATL